MPVGMSFVGSQVSGRKNYNGEVLVEYDGQKFRILRTYRTGQELELVCYREVNPA